MGNIIFPLFFRLSEFADTDEEIADTIPRLLQRNYPDTAPAILPLIAEKLKNGTCLLLLDALDEVPQEQRNPLAEKLNRFARHFPCPIIVTSRIVGYGGGILHDAKEVEIVPFTRKQIDQYIEIWFKNLELDRMNRINRIEENENNPVHPVNPVKIPDAKGLIHELQQKPQIRGLAQNPLLLSLLCSLYQEDELTLPARRVQIYEQAVHYMLYDWRRVSQRRVTKQALTDAAWIEAKLELLEHLAYQFSCEYKEMFSMRELLTKIEECKGGTALKSYDSPDIIKELSQEDGIIQQLDGQGHNARYIFLHRTFQEYLTASYLKRQPNGIELAKVHFWDYDWHETLILFAGLTDDPRLFLNTLLAERDDIFHTLLLLAGKCLAECPQIEMPQLIDKLHDVWQDKLHCEFAEPTVVAIGQNHERMLTHLLTALHDGDWSVKQGAVGALGKIGSARAIEDLLAMLHNPIEGFTIAAVVALEKLGDARAVEGLLAVALHDPNRYIRKRAAAALAKFGDAQAVEGLFAAFHETYGSVRKRAAAALGVIGGARAMEGLLAALHGADGFVRREAAEALGTIGDVRAVEGLLAALYDPDWEVRRAAAEALGTIGDVRAVEGLLAALHNLEGWVRAYAAKALGQIGDKQAVEGLLAALHDPDWYVRAYAAAALRVIGDARAGESLLAVLPIPNWYERAYVAEALGQIGTLEIFGKPLHHLDIDIYDKAIFPVVRRLAITFSRLHPRPACLPVYPQPGMMKIGSHCQNTLIPFLFR